MHRHHARFACCAFHLQWAVAVLLVVTLQQQVQGAALPRATAATCSPVPAPQRATIVYGVIASAAKFETRAAQHIRRWWTNSTRGAVYLDEVTPHAQQVAPPAVPLISHAQLLATHLHTSAGTFGARAVLLVLDLFKRYPTADWYAEVDDDTFLVPANLEVALTTYPPSEPWYLGGTHPWADTPGRWGRHAWGGAGIFLSRGALQLLAPTLAACAPAAGQVYDHSDAALGACVLQQGIQVTYHPGLHFDLRHPTLLEHHPAAPFLGTHQHHAFLSDANRWALAVNPPGFAQQVRVVVPRPTHTTSSSSASAINTTSSNSSSSSRSDGSKPPRLVLSIASGVAVEVWEEGTTGTAADLLPLPTRFSTISTNPPSTTRPPPLAYFKVATTLQQPPSHGCSIVTMYDPPKDGQPRVNPSVVNAAVGFDRVVVFEPWWPDRWLHAPRSLCVKRQRVVASAATGNHVMHVHLGRGPHGCQAVGWAGPHSSAGRVPTRAPAAGALLLPRPLRQEQEQEQQQQQQQEEADGVIG